MSVPPQTDTSNARCLYGSATVVAAFCLLGTMAMAQSRLGAVDGRQPLAGSAFDARRDIRSGEASELAAARMLLLARQELAEGRTAGAQRLLEQLIARHPDSASAIDARRELYALYALDSKVTGGWPAPPAGPAARRDAQAAAGADARSAGPWRAAPATDIAVAAKPEAGADAVSAPIGSGWRTSIVSFRRLQDDLRNSVGDRIFFSGASADLGSRARAVLAAQADWLLRRPEIEIVVEGHADDSMVGGDDDLVATQRAAAVRDRLVEHGVEAGRIRVAPLGSRDRVATCGDSDCAAQNRRAVVLVGVRGSHAVKNPTRQTGAYDIPTDVRR